MPNAIDLDACHPDFDLVHHNTLVAMYRAQPHVVRAMLPVWLPAREGEDPGEHKKRAQAAVYVNKAGPVVDVFGQWLFEEPLVLADSDDKATTPASGAPPLADAVARAFTDACVHQRGWVYVTQPDSESYANRAEQEAGGGLQPIYRVIDPLHVIDWELGLDGRVRWAMTREIVSERAGPAQGRRSVLVWSFIMDTSITTWRLELQPEDEKAAQTPGKLDRDVGPGVTVDLATAVCPLVCMDLVPGLWAMDRMYAPVLGHIRAGHALDWALDAAAFPLLVIKRSDAGDQSKIVVGPGRALVLSNNPNMPPESVEYVEPAGAAFEALRQNKKDYEEDIYRVMRQMALSASVGGSNGAGASGASKMRDQDPVRIVLSAYREAVAKAAGRLVSVVRSMRGDAAVDANNVVVSGMDGWLERSLADFFEACALSTDALAMSPTLAQEVAIVKARKLLDGTEGMSLMDKIEKEIRAAEPMDALLLSMGGGALGDDSKGALESPDKAEPNAERSASASDGRKASGVDGVGKVRPGT